MSQRRKRRDRIAHQRVHGEDGSGGSQHFVVMDLSPEPPMVTCTYCTKPAELVDGTTIYPHRPDLAEKRFWRCEPCKAYVGCHASTGEPFGTLANAELRAARSQAHAAFDPIWRDGYTTRSNAYKRLAGVLGISVDDCHMGRFDVDTCKRVVEAIPELRLQVIAEAP